MNFTTDPRKLASGGGCAAGLGAIFGGIMVVTHLVRALVT